MRLFVDTSAIIPLLDADELVHRVAGQTYIDFLRNNVCLVTTNYVVLETCAVLQRRLGLKGVKWFIRDILPTMNVKWIDETAHDTGVVAVMAARRKKLSLVDCVSFEIMRRLGINTAFTFDRHFGQQGFKCVPRKKRLSDGKS